MQRFVRPVRVLWDFKFFSRFVLGAIWRSRFRWCHPVILWKSPDPIVLHPSCHSSRWTSWSCCACAPLSANVTGPTPWELLRKLWARWSTGNITPLKMWILSRSWFHVTMTAEVFQPDGLHQRHRKFVLWQLLHCCLAENIESCYKTGSSKWVRSEPGPLYVWVKCNNVFRSCNFHYHIVFTCNGCSTTTEATTTEEAPATSTAQGDAVTYASTASTTVAETNWREDCNVDTCKCWSCGTSLSCKESKCTASETFVQTGCSGSIQIYNNVMQGGYTKSGYCAARVVANAASETAVSAVFLVMLALCMLWCVGDWYLQIPLWFLQLQVLALLAMYSFILHWTISVHLACLSLTRRISTFNKIIP